MRVNAIAPGPVLFPESGLTEAKKVDIIERTLLKRRGSPQDIAKVPTGYALLSTAEHRRSFEKIKSGQLR